MAETGKLVVGLHLPQNSRKSTTRRIHHRFLVSVPSISLFVSHSHWLLFFVSIHSRCVGIAQVGP